MEEIWKDVVGYEGLYKVSNFGRIVSLCSYGGNSQRLMSPGLANNGYLMVGLTKNKKQKSLLVHRLVAQAFIPNPDKLDFVNHKDENKRNNNVENLEWCTKSYNSEYSLNLHPDRKKRYFNHFKDKNGKLKRYDGKPPQHEEIVIQKDIKGTPIAIYGCVDYAHKITGVKSAAIIACCKGQQKTAFGYIWEFLEE